MYDLQELFSRRFNPKVPVFVIHTEVKYILHTTEDLRLWEELHEYGFSNTTVPYFSKTCHQHTFNSKEDPGCVVLMTKTLIKSIVKSTNPAL